MKKIIVLVFLFLPYLCFSQGFDLKHYYDYSQNFDGWACAEYIDTLDEDELKYSKVYLEYMVCEFEKKEFTILNKITKQNTWLLQKAMNEWEYKEGEIYIVACTSSANAEEGILFFLIINEQKTFDWIALYFSESDLEKFDNPFSED